MKNLFLKYNFINIYNYYYKKDYYILEININKNKILKNFKI